MANRWGAYHSAKESTISKIEANLKLKDFTTSLPAIVQKDKQFCQKMHQTLLDNLSTSVREFSEKVEVEVKLKDHLDRLDKITEDQENVEREAWRPQRNPLDNQVNQTYRVFHFNGCESPIALANYLMTSICLLIFRHCEIDL